MSARRKQSNSDPLPYVQVDRAVKPKVALLAGAMGVSTQHALGSVVEFWDLCGDPRELERVVESTPAGVEPEVVLPRADIELRFRLASGCDVPSDTLAAVGLVETRGNVARVRGMSRYFEPVLKRISARKAASAGGKARMAGASRDESGRLLGAGALAGEQLEVSAGGIQPTLQPTASRQPADAPAAGQPTASPSGQRSAVSGQRPVEEEPSSTKVVERGPLVYHPPETPPGPGWKAEDFFRWFQACRQTAGFVGEKWPRLNLSHWWAEVLGTPGMSVERLCAGVTSFGQSEHWRGRGLPFGAFAAQWRDFVPALRGAA